ncbi:sensor histidine kinase [Umezawaea beigongshangensis]|uniref:sensor histidine kinase n=1 Tax=Umezawaea beigongshangensis TaxID=2780383 RepID=UPI0018F26A06|nr:sensor histidine kinase [Umezawaea beigongshangensis]
MAVAPATSHEPFVHPALFYAGSAEYLAGTVPFVTDGLDAGEPVAVAVPGPQLDLLRAALGERAGRVRFLDMTRAGRNPGRIIPWVLRAFADQHSSGHVRIIGEPIWPGRSETEYPACVQHEALINHAFTGRHVTILCPYDTVGLDPLVLADAEATHPVLVDSRGQRPSERYAPDHVVRTYNRPLSPPPPGATALAVRTEELGLLRRVAAERARTAGLSGERVEDVLLTVTELAANSIVHGGGSGTVHLWADADHLVVQSSDSGHITDPLAGRLPAAQQQTGGRGLVLVNHLADLVRVHSTAVGTVVRAHFAVGRGADGAPPPV